jgi:hypothetical protein
MSNPSLERNVVKWVHYDNKMKEYSEKIKVLRQERDSLSLSILDNLDVPDQVKNKDLPQFSIDALQTKVMCHKQRNYESLNYKFLTECLREYFQQDQTIEQSEEKAKDVLLYIRQKRGYEEKMILKRDRLH